MLKIYYQDTDSIHSSCNDVDELVLRYKQKYDQEFVGDGLGNLHVYVIMDGVPKYAEICY